MKHLARIIVVVSAASLLFAGPAGAHVRVAKTNLSLSVSKAKVKPGTKVTFKIKLKSPWNKCYAHQNVRWYKNGKFKRIRTTNASGLIKFQKKMQHTGTFQAKYTGRQWGLHPHNHVCRGSASHKVTVKVRHH
jgi:hypothetical protein